MPQGESNESGDESTKAGVISPPSVSFPKGGASREHHMALTAAALWFAAGVKVATDIRELE